MSLQVKKPMPPVMIRAQTVRFILILEENPVSEEKAPCSPIRSKPALQKADTE